LVLSFFIVVLFVILNAQGYDFDWKKRKIVETGGIYIKTSEPGISVYIDGNYNKNTDQFSRDLLVQKLLPGVHDIRVERDGYFTWQKSLPVEEKLVTKAQNIILFPKDIDFEEMVPDVEKVFPVDNKPFLIKKKDGSFVKMDPMTEEIKEILTSVQSKVLKDIVKIEVSPNKERALITLKEKKYYLLSLLDGEENRLEIIEGLGKDTDYPEFNGNDSVYHMDKGYLYSLNLKTGKKDKVSDDVIEGFALHGDGLYTLEKGVLYRTNVYIKTVETMTKEVFPYKEKSTYKLQIIEGRIFLVEDSKVYYMYVNSSKSFVKMIESRSGEVKYKVWSDKVLFINKNEIWLMLLKDFESPFFKKADSFVFLSRFSEGVSDVAWVDDDYFSAIVGGKLRISEIDIRDKINFFELPGEGHSQIWFDNEDDSLMLLSNGKLEKSGKLFP
jgi:hypothetical protein